MDIEYVRSLGTPIGILHSNSTQNCACTKSHVISVVILG